MRSFSLSANIENGFAEGMQYIVTPNAQKAIHNIVSDYQTGIHSFTIIGTYGTGKSSFLLALESDLKQSAGKLRFLCQKPQRRAEERVDQSKKAFQGGR